MAPNATEALWAPGHLCGHKLCSFILPSGTDGDNTTGLSCSTPEVLLENAGDWGKIPNSCCSQQWIQGLQWLFLGPSRGRGDQGVPDQSPCPCWTHSDHTALPSHHSAKEETGLDAAELNTIFFSLPSNTDYCSWRRWVVFKREISAVTTCTGSWVNKIQWVAVLAPQQPLPWRPPVSFMELQAIPWINPGSKFVCCLLASKSDNSSYFSWQDELHNWVLANILWDLHPHFICHQNSTIFDQIFLFWQALLPGSSLAKICKTGGKNQY